MMTKTIGIAVIVLVGASWVQGAGAASPSTQPATQPSTQPAKELTLDLGNNITMKLALIPAGKFTMGSPKEEQDAAMAAGVTRDLVPAEGPQHEVTISKPFYMGVHEVTQEQYEAVMDKNPSNFKGATNPVEKVSWDDAVAFCQALSRKTGKTVRLPTEAEWEYACRAGSKTRFSYGDDDNQLGNYAWYPANSGGTAHPAGQKKPNAFRLYDMHGNVWEWCSDWYAAGYYANANPIDPTGPAFGAPRRVLRGGSWGNAPQYCRSAFRLGYPPDYRYDIIGFRVSVDLPAGQAGFK